MLQINNLKSPKGANKRKKRVGCGPGSGHGKTSTRGHKGQGQHAGSKTYVGFTGGNVPLFRHLPKRGFNNKFKKMYQIVNLDCINECFNEGEVVSRKSLYNKGLIENIILPVKILGRGKLNKKLVFRIDSVSNLAAEKIESAGGEKRLK